MEKKDNVELKSEEVHEVMGQVPAWIIRWGITLLFGIVLLILIGSYFFRYPATISTTIVLTGTHPLVPVVARSSGRIIELDVKDAEYVQEGSRLGIIENRAVTGDVQQLLSLTGGNISDPDSMAFLLSECGHFSLGEIQEDYLNYLTKLHAYSVATQKREKDILRQEYTLAVGQLQNSIDKWQFSYCLQAPVAGYVDFVNYWNEHQYVSAGETVFTIVPEQDGRLQGVAFIPLEYSGKVAIGQRVMVRLNRYPDYEFGMVEGTVSFISMVPSEETYRIGISLPHGLVTSYNRELPASPEMHGMAEIITDDIRLIERFLMPLRKISDKVFH